VTKADGGKFGKTESGAVWLSPEYTSPYAFYQFWLNASDADVPKYLNIFTLLPHSEIANLLREHETNPGARTAHRALASHVTELVHGVAAREQAQAATAALFSGDVAALSKSALEEVFHNAPSVTLAKSRLEGVGLPLVELLVEAAVVKSKREARELLSSNAIAVSARKAEPDSAITADWLLHGEIALIRRGKKAWHVVRFR
jgi:tyrosyl-tRNA synthetase